MYNYDEYDQKLLDQRVAQFRDQVRRRLAGELTEEQFRPLRLRNGLYLQLHAYMLRIAVPYGTLSSRQLRGLGHVARHYDRGFGHFTTRTNMQFHWMKLERVPDALADLAKVQLHGIQTSGNSLRNVTADHLAGVAPDEIEDPRIWSEIVRQWGALHPEFSYLPRKFKICIIAAPHDRAALRIHDLALRLHRNEAGEAGFEVMVGGGLGRTPFLAKTIRKFLPKQHLLSYLEAVLRVYNQHGRRDNLWKARIKILVHELGAEKFAELVETEWQDIKDGPVEISEAEVARIAAQFSPPNYEDAPTFTREFDELRLNDVGFARWLRTNVGGHKQPGYAIVTVSLKPPGGTPGDITAEQMDAVADLADRHSFSEIRVTHAQNLVLPHVRRADLPTVWRALSALGLATPNIGLASDIICCPGLDYCSLANARSIPIARRLTERFDDLSRLHDLGELKIKISGCINACGHHHVGHIGILGVDKNGEEFYQVTLGGSEDLDGALGTILGPAIHADRLVEAVETLIEIYVALRRDGERFLDTYRRVGLAPFKERIYAPA
ncbi:MAG TPA: nitrite/sulfite reductase [Alphaproteobacteria bacterium]|nr:nitrite/sulfite reductase [Alphaproteobacteria bacterium]